MLVKLIVSSLEKNQINGIKDIVLINQPFVENFYDLCAGHVSGTQTGWFLQLKIAPSNIALLRFAPERLAPVRIAFDRFALVRSTSTKTALVRFVFSRLAPAKSA